MQAARTRSVICFAFTVARPEQLSVLYGAGEGAAELTLHSGLGADMPCGRRLGCERGWVVGWLGACARMRVVGVKWGRCLPR